MHHMQQRMLQTSSTQASCQPRHFAPCHFPLQAQAADTGGGCGATVLQQQKPQKLCMQLGANRVRKSTACYSMHPVPHHPAVVPYPTDNNMTV